jgi:uncharacterized protein YggL (DUF469 family)
MKKRLRKKKHIGEFQLVGSQFFAYFPALKGTPGGVWEEMNRITDALFEHWERRDARMGAGCEHDTGLYFGFVWGLRDRMTQEARQSIQDVCVLLGAQAVLVEPMEDAFAVRRELPKAQAGEMLWFLAAGCLDAPAEMMKMWLGHGKENT